MVLGDRVDSHFKQGSGENYFINNISCTTGGTKYPIEIPYHQMFKSILIQARTSDDMKFYRTSSDTEYFTVKSGTALTMDLANATGATVGYVSFVSNTKVAEVILLSGL